LRTPTIWLSLNRDFFTVVSFEAEGPWILHLSLGHFTGCTSASIWMVRGILKRSQGLRGPVRIFGNRIRAIICDEDVARYVGAFSRRIGESGKRSDENTMAVRKYCDRAISIRHIKKILVLRFWQHPRLATIGVRCECGGSRHRARRADRRLRSTASCEQCRGQAAAKCVVAKI
jgi:hypothetical protein